MPAVLIRAKVKGKAKEAEVPFFANSLADFVILTEKVAKDIEPEVLGYEEELEVAGGKKVRGPLCRVKIEVQNPQTGEIRGEEVEAVILKKEKICVLGIKALEKLGIVLDMKEGKYYFK
jgi:predicted aspartyl protease